MQCLKVGQPIQSNQPQDYCSSVAQLWFYGLECFPIHLIHHTALRLLSSALSCPPFPSSLYSEAAVNIIRPDLAKASVPMSDHDLLACRRIEFPLPVSAEHCFPWAGATQGISSLFNVNSTAAAKLSHQCVSFWHSTFTF